jgi:Malectin domain/Bacterial Ig domain
MKLILILILSALSLLAQSTSVTLNVQAYSGNGPANLVSNAIPFKRGALTNVRNFRILDGSNEIAFAAKVLAVWPQDNSIRSVLVQFSAPTPKAYTLQIGASRTTVDASLIPVSWDLPTRIFTLPAAYVSDSLVFWEQKPLGQTGFPSWDSKQLSSYYRIETIGTSPCVRNDHYYDAITTTYQMYARTGDLKYLVNARRWALHHRRDQIYLSGSNIGHPQCSGGYLHNSRYTFPQGLVQDYFMFGDEEAKRVSGVVVDNFYMDSEYNWWWYKAPNSRGFWTERESAFGLMGVLAQYEATNDARYLNFARDKVASLHRMQVENGRRAWVHNLYDHDPSEGCSTTSYGSSPWMSGLLLEGIIKYHKLTGDATARESILMAVDDLRARYLATSGSHAGRSFIYLGCTSEYTTGTPDLDNLISHAYGYAWKLTGNNSYKQLGTDLFNTGTASGVTASHKHYNQQFRSSGNFVGYIASPASSDTTPPTVSLTAPTANQAVSGTITASATASDNVGVTGVQFLVDGQAHGSEDTSAPYSISINTATLSSGAHTIAARARDAAGNVRTSASVSVTVSGGNDNTAPTVAIAAPAAGQTVSGTVSLSANASDNIGVAGVQFLIDGQAYGAEDRAAPYVVSMNTTTLTNGNHTVAATARDAAGNRRTSGAVTFRVSNTTTPPPTTFSPIRVNSGGPAYVDPEQLAWSTDYGFSGGSVFSTTSAIANTTADPMYQDQRSSITPLTYSFTVPNGNYNVFLKFAELSNSTTGQRAFHVDINGSRIYSNFDVYASGGGRFIAVKRTVPISVSGGRIQITFTPVRGYAIINAIEIGRR